MADTEFPPFSHLTHEIMLQVNETWDTLKTFSVLARIGIKLSDKAKAELAAAGGKLKSFILLHMPDQIRYLYYKEITDCIAPLPQSQNISEDELYRRYLETKKKNSSELNFGGRFKTSIWQAFTLPLGPNEPARRLQRLGEDFVSSVTEDILDGQDFYIIEKEDLAFHLDGSRCSIEEAIQKIIDWASSNKVKIEDLRKSATTSRTSTFSHAEENRSTSFSFARNLAQLPLSDLARIKIPADIVFKLFK